MNAQEIQARFKEATTLLSEGVRAIEAALKALEPFSAISEAREIPQTVKPGPIMTPETILKRKADIEKAIEWNEHLKKKELDAKLDALAKGERPEHLDLDSLKIKPGSPIPKEWTLQGVYEHNPRYTEREWCERVAAIKDQVDPEEKLLDWDKIRATLKADYQTPLEDPPASVIEKRKRLAIVVGHNRLSKGADGIGDLPPEFVYNKVVAREIERLMEADPELIVEVFYRKPDLASYALEIEAVYGEVDEWEADLILELHYNSAYHTATGTECLYHHRSEEGRRIAGHVGDAIVEHFGFPRRTDKPLKTTDRGYNSVQESNAPTVIVEPFFGSNSLDVRRAKRREGELAQAIVTGVRAWLNV